MATLKSSDVGLLNQADRFDTEPASKIHEGPIGLHAAFIKKLSCVLGPVIWDVGLLRLIGNPGSDQPYGSENLSRDQQVELSFLSKNPGRVRSGEGCDLEEGMAEVRAAGDLGDRPLMVLTSSKPFEAPPVDNTRKPRRISMNTGFISYNRI